MRTTYLVSIPLLLLLLPSTQARRGALVRDGMSSKISYDNPLLGQAGDITTDPDVAAIASKCPHWMLDPICLDGVCFGSGEEERVCREVLNVGGGVIRKKGVYVTFKSQKLGAGGKRPNWMRATASLGNPKLSSSTPLRAVWTSTKPDTDPSMTYNEPSTTSPGRAIRKEIGTNTLKDNYEDCLKRVYGKYIELEVLLPKTKKSSRKSGPPPSLVYRVPITTGSVNPFGMVSKSRATVTLYPKGRTLNVNNPAASANTNAGGEKDVAIPVGLVNVHVPLGSGLVDPSWVRGKKLFWKGRSVGLV
ncbi:hypothetical protein ACHAXN_002467 [Cyclotella atomus]